MKTLDLTLGQEISLSELVSEMGSFFTEFDKVVNSEITNIDNFNGECGYCVYFELYDTSNCEETDERYILDPENAIVKITSIEKL